MRRLEALAHATEEPLHAKRKRGENERGMKKKNEENKQCLTLR
jgi:hypothetical protein